MWCWNIFLWPEVRFKKNHNQSFTFSCIYFQGRGLFEMPLVNHFSNLFEKKRFFSARSRLQHIKNFVWANFHYTVPLTLMEYSNYFGRCCCSDQPWPRILRGDNGSRYSLEHLLLQPLPWDQMSQTSTLDEGRLDTDSILMEAGLIYPCSGQ